MNWKSEAPTVASRPALLLGSDLYLYFAGYDPAWKKYGVMTVLITEMIKWAFARGIKRINLSVGHDHSKVRWKPHEVRFYDAVQVSPTWHGPERRSGRSAPTKHWAEPGSKLLAASGTGMALPASGRLGHD